MGFLDTVSVWSFWFNIALCIFITLAVFFTHILSPMLVKNGAPIEILEKVRRSFFYRVGDEGAIAIPLCYLFLVLLVCGIWSAENKLPFIEAVVDISVKGGLFWISLSTVGLTFAALYSLSALTCCFLKRGIRNG